MQNLKPKTIMRKIRRTQKKPGTKILSLIVILNLIAQTTMLAQSRFKAMDDSIARAISAEENHKLEAIERLVEATRNFDFLDPKRQLTILAPNNKAFKRLPIQTIDYLVDPAHQSELDDLVTYHTIEGKYTKNGIKHMIQKGEGKAKFNTLAGFPVFAVLDKEGEIVFIDRNNRRMKMIEANYLKGAHPVHIIDGVILPHSAVY
jgi:uncharacterized surface protein with fasciclin (FAS1) repeats